MANKKPIVFYNGLFGQLKDNDNVLDKHSNSIAIRAESFANLKEPSSYFNPTNTIYVDSNRSDTYTENGSISKPYKTLTVALNNVSEGDILLVSRGIYDEDIIVPNGVSIINPSLNQVRINGNVVFNGTGNPMKVQGVVFGGTGNTVTFNGTVVVLDSYSTSPVVIGSGGHFTSFNFNIRMNEVNDVAFTSNTTLDVLIFGGTIESSGIVSSLIQNAGSLRLNTCEVLSDNLSYPAMEVTGGTSAIISSKLVNSSGGPSLDLSQSDGDQQSPNMLSGVYSVGDIICSTKTTVVNGIEFMMGDISGTDLQYMSSNYIKNDSNISGDTISDALNNLSIAINNI
ncbi:MAG: DUF1565 domain-containing protein [bacterium]